MNERFVAARHEEGCYEKASSNIFMLAKVYRTMTSGRQGAPYFRRYRRELVAKPDISLKNSWGVLPYNDSDEGSDTVFHT